jgi:hypothetical protein
MDKHTPWPWKVVRYPDSPNRIDVRGPVTEQFPNGRDVIWWMQERMRVGQPGDTPQWLSFSEEEVANASVIAAAPELLMALEALLDVSPFPTSSRDAEIHLLARIAIRKARS